MRRVESPPSPEEQRAVRLVRRLFERARRGYELRIAELTNERDLYRCNAADLQSQLDRERASHPRNPR